MALRSGVKRTPPPAASSTITVPSAPSVAVSRISTVICAAAGAPSVTAAIAAASVRIRAMSLSRAFSARGADAYARIPRIGCPSTSASRKSRPPKR